MSSSYLTGIKAFASRVYARLDHKAIVKVVRNSVGSLGDETVASLTDRTAKTVAHIAFTEVVTALDQLEATL